MILPADTTFRIGAKSRERLDALLHAVGIGAYIRGQGGGGTRHEKNAKENGDPV
jgi:hypothetical protein